MALVKVAAAKLVAELVRGRITVLRGTYSLQLSRQVSLTVSDCNPRGIALQKPPWGTRTARET